ncbi:MAG: hypothetical protein ACSLE5_03805 [Porticoccaceae bacterium]
MPNRSRAGLASGIARSSVKTKKGSRGLPEPDHRRRGDGAEFLVRDREFSAAEAQETGGRMKWLDRKNRPVGPDILIPGIAASIGCPLSVF